MFLALLLTLLVTYQLKHFLADYVFQGEYMLGKFKPGWAFLKPLLAHVAVHGLGTFTIAFTVFVLFGVPAPIAFAVGIGILDMTIHFFMDRIKAGPRYMGRWKALTGPQYVEWKKTLAAKVGDKFDQWAVYDAELLAQDQSDARKALRGNRLFWIALGFDQMVHHLTHYVCIFLILALVVMS